MKLNLLVCMIFSIFLSANAYADCANVGDTVKLKGKIISSNWEHPSNGRVGSQVLFVLDSEEEFCLNWEDGEYRKKISKVNLFQVGNAQSGENLHKYKNQNVELEGRIWSDCLWSFCTSQFLLSDTKVNE